MKDWDETTRDNVEDVIAEAKRRTLVFDPHCVKCNKSLDDDDYDNRTCGRCGYDSFTSCRMCVQIHYKGLPQDLVNAIVNGFESK
jgi:hypothetical protein